MRTAQGIGTINNFTFKNLNNYQDSLNNPYYYPNYQSQPNIIRGKCEYQINTKKNNCCLNLFNKAYEIPLELNTIKFINKRNKFFRNQRIPNYLNKEIGLKTEIEDENDAFKDSIDEEDSVSLRILETEKLDEIKTDKFVTKNIYSIHYSKTPNKTLNDIKKNKLRKKNNLEILYNKHNVNNLNKKTINNSSKNGGKVDLYNKKGLYEKKSNWGEKKNNNIKKSGSIDNFPSLQILDLITIHKKYKNLQTLQKINKLNKMDKNKINPTNKNKILNKKNVIPNCCSSEKFNSNKLKEKRKSVDNSFDNFSKLSKNYLTRRKKQVAIYKNNNDNKTNNNTKTNFSQYISNRSSNQRSRNNNNYSKFKTSTIKNKNNKTTNDSITKNEKSPKKLEHSFDMGNIYKKKLIQKSNINNSKDKKLKIEKLKLSLFCNKSEEKQVPIISEDNLYSYRNADSIQSKKLCTNFGKIVTIPIENNFSTISSCKNISPIISNGHIKYNENTYGDDHLKSRTIDNSINRFNKKSNKDYNMTNKREKCINLSLTKNEIPYNTDFEVGSNFNFEFKSIVPYKSQKIIIDKKFGNKLKEKYFVSINIEDLLILEEKLNDIFREFLINKTIANECFEFWNYFFNCEIYKNIDDFFFSDKILNLHLSENVKYSINYLLMCILVFYDFSFEKELLDKAYLILKETIELMHINFLLLCKYIISKINPNQKNNNWVLKLNQLRSQIYSYITDYENNKLDLLENQELLKKVISNSEKISKNLYNILDNYKSNSNISLMTLYKKLKTKKYKELNDFFKSFLIREENINGSILVTLFLNDNPNFKTEPCPYITKPNNKKYTLVLDLEETLLSFKLNPDNRELGEFKFRPGVFEFLENIKNYYELIIFTASLKDYADHLINAIEENKKYFDYKFYRQHNIIIDNDFVKDLSRIGRPLDKIIIIDNMPQNYKLQKENGILIKGFWGEENTSDNVLSDLSTILINIYNDGGDVRVGLEKYHEDIISYVTTYLSKYGV